MGLPAPGVPHLTEPSVVVALDLAPADTAALDLTMVLAIVTEQGGPTGHTAIIARQLGLPCVVQTAGATELADGVVVAVDASAGIVTVEPGDELRREFDKRRRLEQSFASDVAPGASSDGAPVGLLANIGTAADAARLTDTAVEGVGLFRTEVLFLDRVTAPTVEEQSAVYAEVLRSLGSALEVLRIVAILATPAVPGTCAEIWRRIGLDGLPADQRLPEAAGWGGYPGGLPVEKGAPLFPRIQLPAS